jgi:hypothetical protein
MTEDIPDLTAEVSKPDWSHQIFLMKTKELDDIILEKQHEAIRIENRACTKGNDEFNCLLNKLRVQLVLFTLKRKQKKLKNYAAIVDKI